MTEDAGIDNQEQSQNDSAAREQARAMRQKRAKGAVIDYAQADEDTKAEMETLMAPIDNAPDSFEAIITFGNPPLAKLGDIANQMIAVQGRFNDQVNVMANALGKLENGLKGMNLDKFGEATRKALKGLAVGTGKGIKGTGRFLGNVWDSISGAKGKRTEDEKVVREMQDALPEMLFEMLKLVDSVQSTEEGIKQVMAEAEKLGIARVEATRDISLYLGAGKEVLRRYNDEYIPEASRAFEESGDPEDELYLKAVTKRKEDFIDRITVLEGSRASSVIAAQQLRQMMETMEDQRKKIQDIIQNSQNEWKAMLAAAGIAGSSLKAAQTIKKADEFGDKLHESTMGMIEEAHKLTQNSKSRGTIDPAKLIEASSRLQKMIESEATNRKARLKQLESTATALRGATDKLLEAANHADTKRQLEAVTDAEKASTRRGADNDNARPARERRRGTDGAGPK
jgi:uncharacterized protein YaaN involved in tellurite resistance